MKAPNCKNCALYQKKRCKFYNIEIEHPDSTTCFKFIEKRFILSPSIAAILTAATAIGIGAGLAIIFN